MDINYISLGNHTRDVSNDERYYYCRREINDSREVIGRGWWKATSHVKKIYADEVVGFKRPLTFHRYKDKDRNRNNAIKTNWIMHEYSLESRTAVLILLTSLVQYLLLITLLLVSKHMLALIFISLIYVMHIFLRNGGFARLNIKESQVYMRRWRILSRIIHQRRTLKQAAQ